MKRRLLTLFSLLLTLLLSVPAMAQDYLAVYLNDGTVDRHMLPLMKSSYASKLDKQGIPHADYVTHVIEMKSGAKYTYDVEMIDSITFAKVDVEEVVETTCAVIDEVAKLFDECQTADELAEIIDQLVTLPNVESVERTGEYCFMIRMKDGKPIGILFGQPDPDEAIEQQLQGIRKTAETVDEQYRNINSDIKIAIANAQATQRPGHIDAYFTPLLNIFRPMGYDIEHIPMPTKSFFTDEMSDYNIVIYCTHGCYDGNLHWHLLGETIGKSGKLYDAYEIRDHNLSNYDFDEEAIFVLKEKINGKYYIFKAISERFIANRSGHFSRNGPKVFFDIACQALKGDQETYTNRFGESFTASTDFATSLLSKGIDEYYGYSETNWAGQLGSRLLLNGFAKGESTEAAYNHLPDEVIINHIVENDEYIDANLMRIVNPSSERFEFFMSVFTEEPLVTSATKVMLNGSTTHKDYSLFNVDFGFEYGLDPTLSSNVNRVQATSFNTPNSYNGNVLFSAILSPSAFGQNIYCRAYTDDHLHVNYGEIKSFRIEPTPVSNIYFEYAEQSMYVGDSRELNCIIEPSNATNPVLEWNSSNPSIATVDQNGVVTALAPGECTITASTTDGSGLMASCVITVTERLDAGDYAYVDLGLPSGLMWATCNIGAQNPYDFGDKFAWGETATKQKFTWSTYTWCNGGNTSITKYCAESNFGTVDGLTQLEPEDDAAHIQWGGVWRMPTYDEQVELKDNCYWQWTSGYNGSNVAGFIVYKAKAESDRGKHSYNNPSLSASYSLSDTHIFLPAAGYMANTTMSYEGVLGSYWSSTLRAGNSANANCFNIYSSKAYNEGSQRCAGLSIRPVW